MVNHIILTVSDVDRSLAFYKAALKPIHIDFLFAYEGEGEDADLWGFGEGKRAFFWLKQGEPGPEAIHWGFDAASNAEVDAFYEAALGAGGKGNISPRFRREFSPDYYAGDVLDPDGYSFEVVHRKPV